MYKLCFYVPASHVEQVKEAVFAAGAGSIGRYRRCSWQVLGQGQFEPLPGSNPSIGTVAKTASVEEYRVEMVLEDVFLSQVVTALRESHPYEEPAFDVLRGVDGL